MDNSHIKSQPASAPVLAQGGKVPTRLSRNRPSLVRMYTVYQSDDYTGATTEDILDSKMTGLPTHMRHDPLERTTSCQKAYHLQNDLVGLFHPSQCINMKK